VFRLGLSGVVVAALALALPAPASAGSDFVATGWNGTAEGDYFRGDGHGITLTGGASTVYRFRAIRTSSDQALPFSPLWQSFNFVVRDDRARHLVSFETAVRGSTDLYRGGFTGEVLYAFVALSPEGRWGTLKLGRQLRAAGGAEGLVRFDGLSASMQLHHLSVEAYAGAELRSRTFVVTSPDDDPDAPSEAPLANDDWVFGVVVGTSGLRTTQLKLGFHDRLRAGRLARRTFTADFHQRLFGRVSLRANLAADLLQRRLAEGLVGIDVRPVQPVRVGVEYEHWRARFDANNIFSVFNTDPFDAVRASGDVRIGRAVSLRASGGVQVSPRAITKDEVPRDEVGRISGLQSFGVRLDLHRALRIDISERLVDGVGGQKVGGALTVRIRPPGRVLTLHVRGDVQRYGFDLQPGLQGMYGGASVRVVLRPTAWMRASLHGEYIFSPWLKNNIQLAATLDFLLGGRIGRPGGRADTMAANSSVRELQAGLLVRDTDPRTSNFVGLTGGLGLGRRTW